MPPRFADSSHLAGDYPSAPLEPSRWTRVVAVALVLTVAACSAALLIS
jgi:hypothetical protein